MPRADGTPTIAEMIAEVDEVETDDRSRKQWPPEEDCPGCDKHRDGPHRFGCTLHGVRATQVVLPVRTREE
jgi:hypothetical protein